MSSNNLAQLEANAAQAIAAATTIFIAIIIPVSIYVSILVPHWSAAAAIISSLRSLRLTLIPSSPQVPVLVQPPGEVARQRCARCAQGERSAHGCGGAAPRSMGLLLLKLCHNAA